MASTGFSNTTPTPAVSVVVLNEDRLLLIQRGKEPHKGRWSFPGGSIEPGETSMEAARREVMEETGLDVRILGLVDIWDSLVPATGSNDGFHYCIAQFLAVPKFGTEIMAASDATDARWVSLDQLEPYRISEAMKRVLHSALNVHTRLHPRHSPRKTSIEGVYVITDDTMFARRSHADVAAAAVAAGARAIQLRDKVRTTGELVLIAKQIRAITLKSGCAFIVNDRVDVALASGADGVHLGVDDMSVTDARAILGADAWIGFSPDTPKQAFSAAESGADYLGVGPIYGTSTKTDAGAAVGNEQMLTYQILTGLPIVAIGGINKSNIFQVVQAGAAAAAVVSPVAGAIEMEQAVRELVDAFKSARQQSDRVKKSRQ